MKEFTYKDMEVFIHKCPDTYDGNCYLVDIRKNEPDAEYIHGWSGIESVKIAEMMANCFIDGFYAGKEDHV